MKKIFNALIACCMVFSLMAVPVSAAEVKQESDVTIIELANNITVEIRLETYAIDRANSKIATKTYTFRNNGREVANATLIAEFEYTGTTARVTGTDYTYTTASGYTYSHGGITTSGNQATMSGRFYYGVSGNHPFSISLTCSGSGTVS